MMRDYHTEEYDKLIGSYLKNDLYNWSTEVYIASDRVKASKIRRIHDKIDRLQKAYRLKHDYLYFHI